MTTKDISSMRGTIEYLKEINDILVVKNEVDPIYEISGIQAAMDNGPALFFENIKGYPGVRDVANVFSRIERMAGIFDISDPKKLKFKCVDAIKRPIAPRIIENAPCQEIVYTQDIDVIKTMPLLKHGERDAGRILGAGNPLLMGEYARGGSEISFKRMNFRGKDWSSMLAYYGTHIGDTVLSDHRGKKVPITVNICTPPAVAMVAATGFIHTIVPLGADELGIAGGLQGFPVDICKAKTVDAYAVANAEWVIEGYLEAENRVWESDEAEKIKKARVAPMFPEWTGYLGRAYRTIKFTLTALTHRKNPIFFTPLADSWEGDLIAHPFKEACYYELADRQYPGLVKDVVIPHAFRSWGGVVIQVQKRRPTDEGRQRDILIQALTSPQNLRMAVIVDEDVDPYSADDVLWAIATRANPSTGILTGLGSGVETLMPIERTGASTGASVTAIGIDATVPFNLKWNYERSKYPVGKIDLKKWFSEEVIRNVKSQQCEYAKVWIKSQLD
ncbi:MAG: UbiD family decarboxylase [Desulfobacterales bacterium]|nr:UbiD family decarboxylase [Desulfobacterales bacterium]